MSKWFNYFILNFLIIYISCNSAFSQAQSALFVIHNLENKSVIWGNVRGDEFHVIDTVKVQNGGVEVQFNSGKKNGVYRLILGQTVYAKVMNLAPQQLDFIYNGEDIQVETDFNVPLDSAKIIKSLENKIWFDFLKREKDFLKEKYELEIQINFFQKNSSDPYFTESKKEEIINRFNHIQEEYEKLVNEIEKNYPNQFAIRLIKVKSLPFENGRLNEQERKGILLKYYFNQIDFTDEELMNTDVYTRKVFQYIMLYTQKGLTREQQETEFNKAIEVVLDKTSANPNISAFIVDYLMRGFEELKLYNLQSYIANYNKIPNGCTDDNSTLQRRLEFQRMKNGDPTPEITLPENNGQFISLYTVANDYKLVLFWATWCPHCTEMMSQLKRWYLHKNIDLEVFAVSIDTNSTEWKDFLKKENLPWINCNEPHRWDGKTATLYNLYATPTMFLLNHENRILAKPLDFSEFLEAVQNLK